jgi:tetratricopeptide (TPR) repeat protein
LECTIFFFNHDIPKTMQFLKKALSLSQASGDAKEQSSILNFIAEIEWIWLDDYAAAQKHAREAQRVSADSYHQARAMQTEASCFIFLGNYKCALWLLQQARERLRMCGMSAGFLAYNIMISQAELHQMKAEYREARNIYTEIYLNTSIDHYINNHASALLNIAEIDVVIGGTEHDIHQKLETAKTIFSDFQNLSGLTSCDMVFADLALREGNVAVATDLFQKCLKANWGRESQAITYCLDRVANVRRWPTTDFGWTSRWAVIYLAYAQKLRQKLPLHKALYFLGEVYIFRDDEDTAHSLFTVALEGFTEMDVHRSRGDCMVGLADIAMQRGDLLSAVKFWTEA